jgi:Uma2 family endonuclease
MIMGRPDRIAPRMDKDVAMIPQRGKRYSYADYLSWSEDGRWELIDGSPRAMSPAPSVDHQRISVRLIRRIAAAIEDGPCDVFHAPFDVRLASTPDADDSEIVNVVQPDVVVICDPDKLDAKGCNGPPDVIIEILSPSTASVDCITKLALYEAHGVREYWIVDPANRLLTVRTLGDDGKYGISTIHAPPERVTFATLPDVTVDCSRLFS